MSSLFDRFRIGDADLLHRVQALETKIRNHEAWIESNIANITAQREKIEDLAGNVQAAANKASSAALTAKEALGKLQSAGEGLKRDADAIMIAGQTMIDTIQAEIRNIGEAYKQFGDMLSINGRNLSGAFLKIPNIIDARIKGLLWLTDVLKYHGDQLGAKLKRLAPIGEVIYSINAILTFLALHENSLMRQTTLLTKEAGNAYNDLGITVAGATNSLKKSLDTLQVLISQSMKRIQDSVMNFINSFGKMASNLSLRLKS